MNAAAGKAGNKASTTARSSARSAATGASKPALKGGAKIGRGTRWSEEQVALLLDTVKASKTAKEGFAVAAKQLGKNTGTVQQKYYAVVRAAGGGRVRKGSGRKPGRPAGSTKVAARAAGTSAAAAATGSVPNAAALRKLSVDELVGLASRVKDEVDRRRKELDEASKLFG